MVTPSDKTRAAFYLEEEFEVSERKACQVLELNRNTKRRLQRPLPAEVIVDKVIELSEAQPRWGYRKVYDRLQLDGVCIGRERVRLIRKRERLQVRKKQHKKRHPGRDCPLLSAQYPDPCLELRFCHGQHGGWQAAEIADGDRRVQQTCLSDRVPAIHDLR